MDRPAQQFAAGLRLLAAEPSVSLHVYYGSVAQGTHDPGSGRPVYWDAGLLGGYTWSAPARHRLGGSARMALWLARQWSFAPPQVVICCGWASPAARACIVHCLPTRTPFLLYSDATWQHSGRGRSRRFVGSAALRMLMRLSHGAISTGTFNREFYILHGMHPRRIWPGVCLSDTQAFAAARALAAGGALSAATAAGAASAAGSAAGTPGLPLRIGFAGKLIPRKGPDELLRAAALLPSGADWCLTVIGDGPMLETLRALAASLSVADRVTFHGFASATQMPALLAACDVVVVPSRWDMRALVTIEAMAAGAAIVVSDATAVWGAGDLVEHEVTGLVYASGSPAALAAALGRLITDRDLLARLRSAGARRADSYGPQAFARSVAAAVTALAA